MATALILLLLRPVEWCEGSRWIHRRNGVRGVDRQVFENHLIRGKHRLLQLLHLGLSHVQLALVMLLLGPLHNPADLVLEVRVYTVQRAALAPLLARVGVTGRLISFDGGPCPLRILVRLLETDRIRKTPAPFLDIWRLQMVQRRRVCVVRREQSARVLEPSSQHDVAASMHSLLIRQHWTVL